MSYFKLFEEFFSMNESSVSVFAADNPYEPYGDMTWPGVVDNIRKWQKEEGLTNMTIVPIDFDYDKRIANGSYRSVVMRNWNNTELPLFLDKNPDYSEIEFDFVGIEPMNIQATTSSGRDSWIRVADKYNNEFLIKPDEIIDIQKGQSIRDGVVAGSIFLVNGERARIIDYKRGEVYLEFPGRVSRIDKDLRNIRKEDPRYIGIHKRINRGEVEKIPYTEWKKKKYTELDENNSENTGEFL
jgi:hypothetical protein